jgi:hypothetical protein
MSRGAGMVTVVTPGVSVGESVGPDDVAVGDEG